jgi:hypothetical protein
MAHWAEINDENIVIRVVVTDNDDPNGDEGYQWLTDNLGGNWVKTSYNAELNGFRKHFAGEGYTYNADLDAFIAPSPYPSWILHEATATWRAPVEHPEGPDYKTYDHRYYWDEEALQWVDKRLQ